MGGKGFMKPESERNEKEWLVVEKAAYNATRGKKQSEGKGAYKTEDTCPQHLL